MNQTIRLCKDHITLVALDMIDAQGAKAFSMRKLAAELGVDPMAIYYHHKSKNALLVAVVEKMLAAFETPETNSIWQDNLRLVSRGVRKIALTHPGAFLLFEGFDDWVPTEHRIRDAFYQILLDSGFSKLETVLSARVILTYVEGFAVDEVSGWFGKDELDSLYAHIERGPYKALLSVEDAMKQADITDSFEFGLDVIITGLERQKAPA
jgi:AcrR family transcriptional regulator